MGWFKSSYDIKALSASSDADHMRKALHGHAFDKRGRSDPWRIPMDHAAAAGNATLASVLLELGSPIWGSSIFEAVTVDAASVLRVFHAHQPKFYQHFWRDKEYHGNPCLTRWTSNFTALDYARSIGAQQCTQFLEQIGAPGKSEFRKCRIGCTGIYIEDDDFLVRGGVNVDGLSVRTQGYYCVKCRAFQNW